MLYAHPAPGHKQRCIDLFDFVPFPHRNKQLDFGDCFDKLYTYTYENKEASMKLQGKPVQIGKGLGNVKSGPVCPMPAKGAMGSAIATIVI